MDGKATHEQTPESGAPTNEGLPALDPAVVAAARAPENASPRLVRELNRVEDEYAAKPSTQDKRTLTRRATEKARRRRLLIERDQRMRNENLVLAIAATGAGWEEVARQSGFSVRHVKTLYHQGLDRIEAEGVTEFRRSQMHSLGVLKQAAYRIALTPPRGEGADPVESARVAVAAMREGRQINDQMNKLQGAYPPAQIEVGGDVTVHRETSVTHVLSIASRVRAARVIEATVVEDERAQLTSGNGSTESNGSAA